MKDAPLVNKLFKHPYFSKHGGKATSLPYLLSNKDNIVSTHQLFLNLNPNILKEAKDHILIIDEMLSVYEKYDEFKEPEIKRMFDNGWLSLKEDGITLIFHRDKYGEITKDNPDPTMDTHYESFASLCDLGQLMYIDGRAVVWELAADTLKSFKEVWIATYLFEDSIMATYLKVHGIEYEIIKFGNKPSEVKHLINIYEDSGRSTLNKVGNKSNALSHSHQKEFPNVRDTLRSNLDNYIRNKVKAKKGDILWTVYKDYKNKIQKNNIHDYSKQWLPLNTKATNAYGDRHTVAYLCNVHPDPITMRSSSARGFTVDVDKYALSEMVQFIWRSAIRNGEEINLYIPSLRMRSLLKDWLEDKYE